MSIFLSTPSLYTFAARPDHWSMFTVWLPDFTKLFDLLFSTNKQNLVRRIWWSRIWSFTREFCVLVLLLNPVCFSSGLEFSNFQGCQRVFEPKYATPDFSKSNCIWNTTTSSFEGFLVLVIVLTTPQKRLHLHCWYRQVSLPTHDSW